jgi:alpha-beta hydrolase superfamily lysophospholipase
MGHGYSDGPLREGSLNVKVKAEKGAVQTGVTYWTGLPDVQRDLSNLCAEEKKRGAPVVVVAESMGAIIAGPLAMNGDSNIDALVTTGGLMRMTKETQPPPIVCFIFEVLGRFMGKRNIIVDDLDKTFDSAFGDLEWAKAARADPLISTNSFYLGPASQNFRAMKLLRKGASKVEIPLFIMHSKADTRTDYEAAADFYADAGSADKQFMSYDDASHLLFLDTPGKTQRAIDDLRDWLDSLYA